MEAKCLSSVRTLGPRVGLSPRQGSGPTASTKEGRRERGGQELLKALESEKT